MSTENTDQNSFTIEVNKVKSIKGRFTKGGNIQISIFKRFEIQPKENPSQNPPTEAAEATKPVISTVRYKKIEDVILDKPKVKQLAEFLNTFLGLT